MESEKKVERIACPDCGLAQQLPAVAPGYLAECHQCRAVLAMPVGGSLDTPLAWAFAALLLWVPASLAPLMRVTQLGTLRENDLATGVEMLWSGGFELLGALVAVFTILIPSIYLTLLVWVLARLRMNRPESLGALFRWVQWLKPWAMIDVYLLGSYVAYSRLLKITLVTIEPGGWCLMGAALALLIAVAKLDDRSIWDALGKGRPAARGGPEMACIVCDLLVRAGPESGRCPRCAARLHRRKPDSVHRTIALVVAGFLLYIPANLLPIVSIQRYGPPETNTILSGVLELIRADLWPLAVIVFVASIVLPLLKLCGLTWMLILTHRGSRRFLVSRTRLYHVIDLIGRWSNIDVFMISILVALVQFGLLSQVRAEPGALAFAAVVVLTMLASQTFDARLMWDAAERGA